MAHAASTNNTEMQIGDVIQRRRKELGMTQEDLAEKLHVTPQAVSLWELGRSMPDIGKMKDLAEALKISLKKLYGMTAPGTDEWALRDRMFSEEHMYSRMKAVAQTEGLEQTFRALSYMKEKHAGQYRKPAWYSDTPIPYIIHPLMMACHAHALGIKDDGVLAVTLLHDVCEDCGVSPDELPFSDEVREAVEILTKVGQPTDEYYARIRTNPTASIVKILDRCNNVSTMGGSFSTGKLVKYVNETEEYVLPLINYVKEQDIRYADQAFVLKYHILSILETVKNLKLHG